LRLRRSKKQTGNRSNTRAKVAAWTPQWLSQVCPPEVMERTNPKTKLVYQISQVEGTLNIEPAC